MNRYSRFALVAGMLLLGFGASSARAATLDGKKIFQDQKCDMCHAVSAAGITPTGKGMKAPDLTEVAPKEDATFLAKFLRKEADHNGKKHLKAFTGSDEEMGALVAWLQKQTKAPAKK